MGFIWVDKINGIDDVDAEDINTVGHSIETLNNEKVDKDGNKVLSDNNYTTEEKEKLSSIEEGAEVNVQVDWEQNDNSEADFIKNKPDLSNYITFDDTDNVVKEGIISNTNTLTEEEQTAAQTWLGGKMIKTLEAGTYNIWELEEGVYLINKNSQLYYKPESPISTDNATALLNLTSTNLTYKNYYLYTQFSIIYGVSTSDGGSKQTLNLLSVPSLYDTNIFSAIQKFRAIPKMTATLNANDNSTNIPNTQWVNSVVEGKTDEAKAYTDTKVADIVNSAPETLDTLNEIATALGNDPNFATTIIEQLGTKANSDSVYTKEETYTQAEIDSRIGVFPLVNTEYAPEITIQPNKMTNIATLTGAVNISLADGIEGYDNEWCFVITMGETEYDIVLPEINWTLSIAPTFEANSVTEVRLHYKGDRLEGVWN